MTTAGDLILLSLREAGVVGVGQTAQAQDFNDSLKLLNGMISQWRRRRWLVYHLVETTFQANGALFYTVGPTGDFDIVRPDTIESAFFRQNVSTVPNNVDYPLKPLRARENYNEIALKSLASFPQVFFYDSGWPLGKLYVWPLPDDSYELHINTKAVLQEFASLTDEIDLPPEYEEALHYNLARRLQVLYSTPRNPDIVNLADLALNTIKNSNAQIALLTMPQDLIHGSNYNIYSDQSY